MDVDDIVRSAESTHRAMAPRNDAMTMPPIRSSHTVLGSSGPI